jgi:TetR/AcrR family transcriptional repressor of mexCD-oprJ operon
MSGRERSAGVVQDEVARPLRADAQRNVEAILDAALTCLGHNPSVSIGEIAEAAGVGRITLYGHFSSRAALVDAVAERVIDTADRQLGAVPLDGEPRAALVRIITSSWQMIEQHRNLLVVAERELPAERLREIHEGPMRRIRTLIRRGRREGAFRTDLPEAWLVSMFYSTLHAAAGEIAAGRLSDRRAADLIASTLLATFTAPGDTVPTTEIEDTVAG